MKPTKQHSCVGSKSLEELKRIAEAAKETDREWRTGIERGAQVGYELEEYFAACRSHRDNPRKNHFELAEKDREHIATFNPSTVLALIADYEKMRDCLQTQHDHFYAIKTPSMIRMCLDSLTLKGPSE